MVIGILQFDLLIHGAASLKDKRRVVSSVKDRLHREHMVSVAEIGALESWTVARLGLAAVGNDGKRIGQMLDGIVVKLRSLHDAELGGVSREVLHGAGEERLTALAEEDPATDDLTDEMLRRADELDSR